MRSPLLSIFFVIFSTVCLQAQQDTGSCPCCTSGHRAFDFWIGEWNVYQPDGKLAGTNLITVQQDSCILREEWTSSRGTYTGTSYNYYDVQDGMWHQLWIDNQGGVLNLAGNRTENQMILASSDQDKDGNPVLHRITWTANTDSTVRQHWQSKTGNNDWKTLFDGLYKRDN